MRHAFAALCAVLLAGAVAPPTQAATITVGSDLTGTVSADNGCEGQSCTRLLVSVNGVGQSSPVDGVVVRWRAIGQGIVRLRLARPDTGATWRAGPASEFVAFPTGSERGEWATRLPIAAGDFLGVDAGVRSGVFVAARCNCPDPRFPGTATTAFWLPLLEDGQVRQPFATTTGLEALVNVDVESDADHDGFGDDTQDCAPADPAVHDTCGATPAPGPSPPASPVPGAGATPPPPATGPTPASPASPAPATPGAPAAAGDRAAADRGSLPRPEPTRTDGGGGAEGAARAQLPARRGHARPCARRRARSRPLAPASRRPGAARGHARARARPPLTPPTVALSAARRAVRSRSGDRRARATRSPRAGGCAAGRR